MKKLIKQCFGIDVSKDTLDVAQSLLDEDFQVIVRSCTQFENNKTGIRKLISWIHKQKQKNLPFKIIMEATGVYHEQAAYNLHDQGLEIAIVLPNKIKNYCKSTNIRTVTDKISARQIAEFGLVKKLENWKKPDLLYIKLKGLCRERIQLIRERTIVRNQKHAKDCSQTTHRSTIDRTSERIKYLGQQIKAVETDIKNLLDENLALKHLVEKICSIKGVGLITVITIIAETDAFNLIKNVRQLACYAGYDIQVKESGTSVKSKPKISHAGNKYIRTALYFPSITVVKYEEYFTGFYNRLYEKNKVKMKGYVAVQRKLLILIYTLWKKQETYNAEQHRGQKLLEQPQMAALTELEHVRS